jgi:hypothetical protein
MTKLYVADFHVDITGSCIDKCLPKKRPIFFKTICSSLYVHMVLIAVHLLGC